MTIVTVSIPDELLERTDSVAEENGFAGRSDLVRHALRSYLSEVPSPRTGDGEIIATVTVISERRGSRDVVGAIQHAFESMITAQMHAHLDEKNCLEVLAVKGRATEVAELASKIRSVRGVKQVKHITVSQA